MIQGPSHGKVVMCSVDAWDADNAETIKELNLCTHLILSYDSLGMFYCPTTNLR